MSHPRIFDAQFATDFRFAAVWEAGPERNGILDGHRTFAKTERRSDNVR